MEHESQLTAPIVIGPNQIDEQGVQPVQPLFFSRLDTARWEDVRSFTAVSETGSFRAAATILKCSVNTVRSRIFRLESVLRVTVFHRTNSGTSLTRDGESLLKWTMRMRSLADQGSEIVPDADVRPNGEVQIGCSEGLGTFCLVPSLAMLQKQLPRCSVHLVSHLDQAKVHDRRHDVSVAFERPKQLDLVAARVATAHFMLFCSTDYARRNGIPKTIDELADHCYIEQTTTRLGVELADVVFGDKLSRNMAKLRVDSSFALFWAIANDIGIGALPTYAANLSHRLIPIDLPLRFRFDIWMSYDPRHKDRTVTRAALAWLRGCFDPTHQPWFAEQFYHPKSFSGGRLRAREFPILDQLAES